ncbi:MAG TPA: class II fumarate hydratase, partial [Paludibacter sp.]|nr:class II fumarate hydratase [Paludibacter sp.]
AQTQRSWMNFPIGPSASMPIEVIHAFAYLKKAAAITNAKFGLLPNDKLKLISDVCDEIIAGKLDDQFPLVIWQTGSGTHTNMNCNEVIANRSHVLQGHKLGVGSRFIHPNDDVNMSQSSNDTFPTAMNMSAYRMIVEHTIPAIEILENTLLEKSKALAGVVKIGRTHLMDATPITLGQEFSGYASQLDHGLKALKNTLLHLSELPIGGTAVGTGLNAPAGFDVEVAETIAQLTNLPFVPAQNKFESLAANDAIVETHAAVKQLAVSLMKIANDIRLSASGPRSGIGELLIPGNEPGSSIMPGKVNPTQAEALTMVCVRVMGNDTTISMGGASGQFELNVFKPLLISTLLESASLLADACRSFNDRCVAGIEPNMERIEQNLNNSLMLVTALSPHIGYDKAALIAKKAYANNISLKEAALESGFLTEKQFDEWVVPKDMTGNMTV